MLACDDVHSGRGGGTRQAMPHVSQRLVGDARHSKPSSGTISAGSGAAQYRHRKLHSDADLSMEGEVAEGEARGRRRTSSHQYLGSNSSSGEEYNSASSREEGSGRGRNGDGDSECSGNDDPRSSPRTSDQRIPPLSRVDPPSSASLEEAHRRRPSSGIIGNGAMEMTSRERMSRRSGLDHGHSHEHRVEGVVDGAQTSSSLNVTEQRNGGDNEEAAAAIVTLSPPLAGGLRQRRMQGNIKEMASGSFLGQLTTKMEGERDSRTTTTAVGEGQVIEAMKESWTCPVCLQSFDEPCILPDCKCVSVLLMCP